MEGRTTKQNGCMRRGWHLEHSSNGQPHRHRDREESHRVPAPRPNAVGSWLAMREAPLRLAVFAQRHDLRRGVAESPALGPPLEPGKVILRQGRVVPEGPLYHVLFLQKGRVGSLDGLLDLSRHDRSDEAC